jgi:hypothetical protein
MAFFRSIASAKFCVPAAMAASGLAYTGTRCNEKQQKPVWTIRVERDGRSRDNASEWSGMDILSVNQFDKKKLDVVFKVSQSLSPVLSPLAWPRWPGRRATQTWAVIAHANPHLTPLAGGPLPVNRAPRSRTR